MSTARTSLPPKVRRYPGWYYGSNWAHGMAHETSGLYQRPKVLTYATHLRRGRCRPASTTSLVARKGVVDGRPPPTMTGGESELSAAGISPGVTDLAERSEG